jgi:hypothetical protein
MLHEVCAAASVPAAGEQHGNGTAGGKLCDLGRPHERIEEHE